MRVRRLGRSSLEVPVVSFGAWAIGGWYWGGPDDERALAALREALALGMRAIDTAPIYGFGHSERLIGRAIAGRRDQALLMTKAGLRWDDDEGERFFDTAGPEGRKVSVRRNSRPASLRLEVERSLERLAAETLDLVQIHWPDPTTPIADSMGALLDLRREGKLREIGVSNFTPAMLGEAQAALGDVQLASDQPKYSLLERDAEAELLPFLREHRIGCLVYSPLAQGLLTGRVGPERTFAADDGRAKHALYAPDSRRRVNETLARVVEPIARAHDATVAQTVIAWTIDQPGVTSALVGARTPEQVRENAAAGALELSAEERAAIRSAFEALALEPTPGRGLRGLLRRLRGR